MILFHLNDVVLSLEVATSHHFHVGLQGRVVHNSRRSAR